MFLANKTFRKKYPMVCLVILSLLINCGQGGDNQEGGKVMKSNENKNRIRYPAVADQFYKSNPAALKQEVEQYISKAEYFPEYEPIAIVAPHAGYVFSGWIAGYSYRQVMGKKYEAVVVISPSHVEYFPFSSVMTEGFYQTPLGNIQIHTQLAQQICEKSDLVQSSDKGHFTSGVGRSEHALEVQLPFLQVALGDFKLIPIVMGDQSWELCKELGRVLGETLKGKNALIVASTDLSHFHQYQEANRMDSILIELLEEFEPEKACQQLNERKVVEACGGGPVVASMIAGKMLGAEGLKALKHANSGDVPYGSKDSVVGYLSAVIYKKSNSGENENESNQESSQEQNSDSLTIEEKRQLMEIAVASVEAAVKKEKIPQFKPISAKLQQERGAFVTLKKDGQLRGCIGYIIPVKPLYLTVQDVAQSAALRDPRFPPVTVDELPYLEYEISALSPVRIIDDINGIEIGKHGLIIRRGYNQGLLLPQVATEYNWNVRQFLDNTCRKAGLPTDAWQQEGTEISVFSAEVFGEEDLK